jgi:hypothetical protein
MRLFGGHKPITVDFWVSTEEKKQEQKQKSQQELESMLNKFFQ